MRRVLQNLLWVALQTVQFWWNKAVSLANWISVYKLPSDAAELFGSFGITTPTLILVGIGFIGLYLTNRDFWHGIFWLKLEPKAERPKLETILWVMLILGIAVSAVSAISLSHIHNSETHVATTETKELAQVASTADSIPSTTSATQSSLQQHRSVPLVQLGPHPETESQTDKPATYDIQDTDEAKIKGNSVGNYEGTFLRSKGVNKIEFEDNTVTGPGDYSLPAVPAELSSLSVVQLKERTSALVTRMKQYSGNDASADFGNEPFDLAAAILAKTGPVTIPMPDRNSRDIEEIRRQMRLVSASGNVIHRKWNGPHPATSVAEFLELIAGRLK